MVEDELSTHKLERQGDEEDQIRRIAGVDRVEPSGQKDLPCQHGFPEQGGEVLDDVAQEGIALLRHRMTKNIDPIDMLPPTSG